MQTTIDYLELKKFLQDNIKTYPIGHQRLILNYIDPSDYKTKHADLHKEATDLFDDAMTCDQDVIDDMLSREPA